MCPSLDFRYYIQWSLAIKFGSTVREGPERNCFQEWSREAQLGKPRTRISHHHGYCCLHQPRCPRIRSISSHSGKRQAHYWPVFQIWEQTLRSVMDNLKVTPPSLILRVNAL